MPQAGFGVSKANVRTVGPVMRWKGWFPVDGPYQPSAEGRVATSGISNTPEIFSNIPETFAWSAETFAQCPKTFA